MKFYAAFHRKTPSYVSLQIIRVMKLTCILIILTLLQVSASTRAQNITLKENNVSLEKVLKQIRKQSGYGLVYTIPSLSSLKPVSIDVKNSSLVEVLKQCFANQPVSYSIEDKTIVVHPILATNASKIASIADITGLVTSDNGPLANASVLIKGTNKGAVTNESGHFTLSGTDENSILVVSFLGYQKQEIKVGKRTFIEIKLKKQSTDLDEAVVVAYGTSTKRLNTSAITTIKGEELKNIPTANFATLLQGRVAGLDVANISSSPGGGGLATTLRGYNAVSAFNSSIQTEDREFSNPLWVIDGVPLQNLQNRITGTNALSEIDPSSIESIEVLKDASAGVLYGSRANNGVILVTTKKGKAGESKLSANVSQSYTYLPEFPTITAGVAARRYKLQALANYRAAFGAFDFNTFTETYQYPTSYIDAYNQNQSGGFFGAYDYWWRDGTVGGVPQIDRGLQDSLNSFHNNSTNFFKLLFNTGKVTDANIQASGGSTNFVYNFGLGTYNEQGIVRNSGFNRLSLLSNMSFTPTKRATFNFRANFAYTSRKRANAANSITDPSLVSQLPDFPFETSPFLPGPGSVFAQSLLNNFDAVKDENENLRVRLNISLHYRITNDLSFTTTNSLDYSQAQNQHFVPSFLNNNGGLTNNLALSTNYQANARTILTENLLNYKKQFGSHYLEVLAGQSYQHDQKTSVNGYGYGSPSDYIQYVLSGFPYHISDGNGNDVQLQGFGSDFEEQNLLSFLGRINYTYKGKYNLSVSSRRDGSSVFGKALPYANFSAVSASWNFSDEPFAKGIPGLEFGKLRASWGQSGRKFDSPYLAYGALVPSGPFNGKLGYQVSDAQNPLLRWEGTTQTDIGADLDFIKNKLGITFDYYYRYTDNLLYKTALPSNYNLLSTKWLNAAAISNQGVEFAIHAQIVNKKDFSWRVNFNIAHNSNRFEKSYDGRDLSGAYVIGKSVNGIYVLQTSGIIKDANSIPGKYTASGQYVRFSPNGNNQNFYQPGDLYIKDQNGDGKIDQDDLVFSGTPLPKAQGGLINDIAWKHFDVSVVFAYALGRTILNGNIPSTIGVTANNLDYPILANLAQYTFWNPANPNQPSNFPILALDTKGNYTPASDIYLQHNVNYVKLKTIVLGYNLDKLTARKLGISGARLFVSGENLLTITNYKGLDPETVDVRSGVDYQKNYPLARRITIGLTANF